GPQSASRPLFYELQGLVWWITGISFTAGRLLSLLFGVILIGSVVRLQRALGGAAIEVAIAVAVVVAVPVFAQQTLAGETDVPAAAMVALTAALALNPPRVRGGTAAVAVAAAAAAAVLTKQTVLTALVPLAVVLFAGQTGGIRARLRTPAAALAG